MAGAPVDILTEHFHFWYVTATPNHWAKNSKTVNGDRTNGLH
jgi:hypothetical protein